MPRITMPWEPSPPQIPVIVSSAANCLCGGARGGGKTDLLGGLAVEIARNVPDAEVVAMRADLDDFRATTLKAILQYIPPEILIQHHVTEQYIKIQSVVPGYPSTILYKEGKDPGSLLSANLTALIGDEAFEIPRSTIANISGALRRPIPRPLWDKKMPGTNVEFGRFPAFRVILASNPAPCWLMDEYPVRQAELDRWRRGEWGVTEEGKRIDPDYAYFPFTAKDNPHLPPGYYEKLIRDYEHDPVLLARYVYGVWDATMEGLVYQLEREHRWNSNDLREGKVKRLLIPNHPVVLGIDPSNGAGVYACVMLQFYEGRVYQVDEWGRQGGIDEDLIDYLQSQPYANDITEAICDSAKPDSITRLRHLGLPARGCQRKDVVGQINAVRAAMRVDPATGRAAYLMDEARCPRTREEFGKRAYRRPDQGNPDRRVAEQPIKAFDHFLNALEYVIVEKLPVAGVHLGLAYRDPVIQTGGKFSGLRPHDAAARGLDPLDRRPSRTPRYAGGYRAPLR